MRRGVRVHQRAGRRAPGGTGRTIRLALLLGLALLAFPPSAPAQTPGVAAPPIPTDPENDQATPFEGTAASPNPVQAPAPPQHPFMAPNERNNIHNDAYMSDVYAISGPLGDGAETSALYFRECASVMFESRGRIVTICVGLDRPVLALLDPHTLQTLASMPLPIRNVQSSGIPPSPFNDFSGGGYFYLDEEDHAVLPTNDRHVLEVAIEDGAAGPSFAVVNDYDLGAKVLPSDGIISVLPDWSGRLWFVTRSGTVGTIDPSDGTVRTTPLGEGVSNSFAVDESGGVFIVSDAALYRFDAGSDGEPDVTWRAAYPDSGIHKPGQSDAGSGTTPTLMGDDRVAITDNADPMDVVVYRRDRRRGGRLVCSEPVFPPGQGATDNTLIGTDRSIVVENNHGYTGPASTMNGGTTTPGFARVDVVKAKGERGRYRCVEVWTNTEDRAPSVVPKLSLANGLVYAYTKPPRDDDLDAWYLTALDFRTGDRVYRRLAGTGFGHNNNWAPVTIGPDGTAYVGVLGGLVAFP